MDAVINVVIIVLAAALFATLGVGWISGIILAHRTTLVPRHHMPQWRRLSKLGWIIAMVGWGVVAIAYGAYFIHMLTTHGRIPTIYPNLISAANVAGLVTFFSPILWIVAWFQARRPEKIMPHPNLKLDNPEGAWPPPPSADRVDQ